MASAWAASRAGVGHPDGRLCPRRGLGWVAEMLIAAATMIGRSSAVERRAVNSHVAGSIPAAQATAVPTKGTLMAGYAPAVTLMLGGRVA